MKFVMKKSFIYEITLFQSICIFSKIFWKKLFEDWQLQLVTQFLANVLMLTNKASNLVTFFSL